MVSDNKKRRKNNRANKRNRIKRDNQIIENSRALLNKDEDINETDNDELEQQVNKRTYAEDHSDEDAPKKKKKKPPVPTDSTDKGKKSIRQMKREKFAQRQAEIAITAKDQLKSQCISYLSQWKHDKQNWKFMKAKQVWLYKNKFSSYLLPDSSWPLLLEYFVSAKGNVRNLLLKDANEVIKQMDEWTESQNHTEESAQKDEGEKQDTTEETKKPDETAYKRARDLIQCLQE